MTVDLNWLFARKDVFPSWWANAIQQALTSVNTLHITRKSATVIQVAPHATLGVAGVIIEGKWRMNEATVERTVSGAKATYSIWAVAKKNEVDNTPAVFTDHTVYTWELRVTSGAAPTGEGIDITEKIGEVDWSGAAIEKIRQTYGSVGGAQIEDGALSSASGSDITWTRDVDGGLLAGYKAGSVAEGDVADGAITSRKTKLSMGVASASGATASLAANTWTSVTGCSFEVTPAVAGTLHIVAIWDIELTATAGTGGETYEPEGSIKLNAEAENVRVAKDLYTGFTNLPMRRSMMQAYALPVTAAKQTIQQRIKKNAYARRCDAGLGCSMAWILL